MYNLLSKGKKPHPEFSSWRGGAGRIPPHPCTPLALGKAEMKFLHTIMSYYLSQGFGENSIVIL